MIKFFNVKRLDSVIKSADKREKSRKENINTNLGGLKQDTLELKNNASMNKCRNSVFTGKSAKNLQGIQNKVLDQNHRLRNGLKDKYVEMINNGLQSDNPGQAEDLVISIGQLANPVINEKLTKDIIVPLLENTDDTKVNIGISIARGIAENSNNAARQIAAPLLQMIEPNKTSMLNAINAIQSIATVNKPVKDDLRQNHLAVLDMMHHYISKNNANNRDFRVKTLTSLVGLNSIYGNTKKYQEIRSKIIDEYSQAQASTSGEPSAIAERATGTTEAPASTSGESSAIAERATGTTELHSAEQICFIGGVAKSDERFAKKYINKLYDVIRGGNPFLANQTIKLIGEIGGSHQSIAEQSYEEIEKMSIDNIPSNNITKKKVVENLTEQKLNSLIGIVEKQKLPKEILYRNFDMLSEYKDNENENIAIAAVKGFEVLGTKHPRAASVCADEIIDIIEKNKNKKQRSKLVLNAVNAVHKIAQNNETVKTKLQSDTSLPEAVFNIRQNNRDKDITLAGDALNLLINLKEIYAENDQYKKLVSEATTQSSKASSEG